MKTGSVNIVQGIACFSVVLDPPIASLPTEHCATFDAPIAYAVGTANYLGWPLVDETGRLSFEVCCALLAAHVLGEP